MTKIRQLSPQEAQKIAAGQVVERPANVVKELIENSIDAGGSHIEIYIEDAGKKLIHVIDNGCGMSQEDAELCFKRHATSKIEKIEQLPSLTTFGFRGEALASIAAVSTITLITRESSSETGIHLVRHEDKNQITYCTSNVGTDIAIKNLFYNVPARKKFLKKDITEWRHIQSMVQAFCLSYPTIHFKLYHNNTSIYNCPATTSYKERAEQVWDGTAAKSSVNIVKTTDHGITVEGVITHQQHFRYDRNALFFFVNNRWIKNYEVARALLKGYMNVLPPARYPATALIITIDPEEVDINVHPRKEEVQFLHPRRVETVITKAIQTTLEQKISSHLYTPTSSFKQTAEPLHALRQEYSQPQNFSFNRQFPMPFSATPYTEQTDESSKILARPACLQKTEKNQAFLNLPVITLATMKGDEHVNTVQHTIDQETDTSWIDAQLIGQLHNTYILLDKKEGLFIIDQHAAHERILYEQFKQERFAAISSIALLFPVSVELGQEQYTTIEPYFDLLQEYGLQIEPFGLNQLIIKAAPIAIKHIALDLFLKEIIAWITESDALDTEAMHKTLHEKIHAQMACKAAVKAGDILTPNHMKQLIKDLSTTKNRFTCPHGRPTGWLIPLYDIEKKFKRKL